jgi:hypothetical protein
MPIIVAGQRHAIEVSKEYQPSPSGQSIQRRTAASLEILQAVAIIKAVNIKEK